MIYNLYLRLLSVAIKFSVYVLLAASVAYPNMYIWNKVVVPFFSFCSSCNFQQTFLVSFAWFMFASDPFEVVYAPISNKEEKPEE